MRHYPFPYGYERGILDWLFPLLLVVLFIAVLVLVARALWRPRETNVDADPLRRAAARYASGDIERVEFERIQRDLTRTPAPGTPLEDAALRLAHGEITTEEFDSIKDRLTESNSP